jgi:hypothetical protein
VIEIVPHANGEIFLSKLAISDHPDFFGFPFSGATVPKKAGNPSYPKRVPDPVADWTVFDASDRVRRRLTNFALNTVYYEKKHEIRITVLSVVAAQIPGGSVLHMTRAEPTSGLDYVCDVYPPGSPSFTLFRRICTTSMPSGGPGPGRRYGWV